MSTHRRTERFSIVYQRRRNYNPNITLRETETQSRERPLTQNGFNEVQLNQQEQPLPPEERDSTQNGYHVVQLSQQAQPLSPSIVYQPPHEEASTRNGYHEGTWTQNRNFNLNVTLSETEELSQERISTQNQNYEVRMSEQGQPLPLLIIDVESIDDDVVEISPRAFAEAKRKRTCTRRRVDVASSDSAEKEIKFMCPICLCPIEEEMSTMCGHIFCKKCIKTAIAAQSKCPTCRKMVIERELIRVFLPAINSE